MGEKQNSRKKGKKSGRCGDRLVLLVESGDERVTDQRKRESREQEEESDDNGGRGGGGRENAIKE